MGECNYKPDSESTKKVFQIDGYKAYNHMTRVDLEKLACEGVVAVGMRINKCIKHYISGIIDDRDGSCDCSQFAGPNHAVALVGFGIDFSLPSS